MNIEMENAIQGVEKALGLDIIGYGSTALNVLRLEGGFIVPGWDTQQIFEDITYERTPAELGLSWIVDLERKDEFVGRKALIEERSTGPRFNIMGFTVDSEYELMTGIELYAAVDGHVKNVGTCP